MPLRGTDGFERAADTERLISPIEAWAEGRAPAQDELAARIHALLGEPDPAKRFLAAFLALLLRAQALSARRRAEARVKKPEP